MHWICCEFQMWYMRAVFYKTWKLNWVQMFFYYTVELWSENLCRHINRSIACFVSVAGGWGYEREREVLMMTVNLRLLEGAGLSSNWIFFLFNEALQTWQWVKLYVKCASGLFSSFKEGFEGKIMTKWFLTCCR